MTYTKNTYTAVFLKAANKEVDDRTFDQLKTRTPLKRAVFKFVLQDQEASSA